MNPPVIRYPLDLTGVNPNNLVSGEVQTMPARQIRVVGPNYGPFYTQGLIVTDMATNLPLTPDQYYPAQLNTMPTLQSGLEVCSIIMITDPTVSANVSLQYQVVGGEYSASVTAIVDQIYNLNLDDRPAAWPAIIGKPNAFNPSAHLHDDGDLFGFEYWVEALNRIASAILLGDEASHDAIYKYIDTAIASLQGQTTALQAQLNAHLADFGNPHKTTAAQVGAYTIAQSDANLSAAVTTLNNSINAVNTALTAHENNFSNPHKVTAAQVGAYTTAQSDANLAAAINAAKLPFTPVQQGGGASQLTNKVYAGWDGARVRLQVDSTDLGGIIVSSELTANVNSLNASINATATNATNYTNATATNLQNNINTKAPANPGNGGYLYVSAGQTATLGDIHANGTIYCANDIWAFFSDERLKENIMSIKGALGKLHQITGVTYNHNEHARGVVPNVDTTKRFMGFLAGQVQKVAPEIVGLASFDRDEHGMSISGENYLTLQYEKMTALIAEAVKEVDLKLDGVIRGLKRAGLGSFMPAEDVEFSESGQYELIPA